MEEKIPERNKLHDIMELFLMNKYAFDGLIDKKLFWKPKQITLRGKIRERCDGTKYHSESPYLIYI
jgi:hypothetical protein